MHCFFPPFALPLADEALTLVFSRRANYGLKERQDWDEAGMLGNRELTVALVIEVGT